MPVWIRLILIVLLAMRAEISAAQIAVLQSDYHTLPAPSEPATEEKKQVTPEHPACLTEEQESNQTSLHMRWPLLSPTLPSSTQTVNIAWQTFKISQPFAVNTPLQAYYRLLLYPAHFFS